ncbi:hypothetical protein MKW94_005647 [Papaver nudicaule]|uniref:Exocyst subunit Exo70 family protein n=1 Tax=Papaver nudicaule TaxID=74823 RepID=A0AA41RYS3_PAPNU|nr:hypothetical protein [Papaver nudicaule]MCL7025931.1 hypothetical protein [Papaver nudicaule]
MATKVEEGDEKLVAVAQTILKNLGTSENITQDMIFILSKFDCRFSNVFADNNNNNNQKSEIEEQLEISEKVILKWEEMNTNTRQRNCIRWEDSHDEASEYLKAVDDVIRLTEEDLDDCELKDRAESLLQQAMARLEDEFRHVLARNTVPLDGDRLSSASFSRRVSVSFASNEGENQGSETTSVEDGQEGYCEEKEGEEGVNDDDDDDNEEEEEEEGDGYIDLINPNAVCDLREIAERMIRSGYEKEWCQVYSSVRRDVLDECLSILGIEKLSIEEVQKIEWRSLDEKMKKWTHAVKNVISILLPSEKQLIVDICGGSELITEVCFTETTKGCVMQLLNFGEAIIIGRRASEKLFRILDMYDALADVMPGLQALYPNDSGEFLCNEAQGILDGLGESARGTLAEFENAVQGETSRKATHGGEIHPLTRYVMNYLKLLVDYSDSLNMLLKGGTEDSDCLGSDNSLKTDDLSPVGHCLLSLISSLESNLQEKSKFYEEGGIQYIFLMNNILYIVQKVKDSELGKLLGDPWVRKRRGQVRQYATSYLRASWSKALSFMKDEGIGGGGSSSSVSKVVLKDRFKNFNACFEDIYRNQSAWKVTDPQLREELRLSISEKVLPAYRSFMGRFRGHLERGRHSGKYIKYTPEDLENYLLDLFEGMPRILQNPRRTLSS